MKWFLPDFSKDFTKVRYNGKFPKKHSKSVRVHQNDYHLFCFQVTENKNKNISCSLGCTQIGFLKKKFIFILNFLRRNLFLNQRFYLVDTACLDTLNTYTSSRREGVTGSIGKGSRFREKMKKIGKNVIKSCH